MANNRELSQFANTVGYSDGSVGIGTAKPLDPPHASNTKVLSVGIVTANYLYGDGSNLTGVSGGSGSTAGINTLGTSHFNNLNTTGFTTFASGGRADFRDNLEFRGLEAGGANTLDWYDSSGVVQHSIIYNGENFDIGGGDHVKIDATGVGTVFMTNAGVPVAAFAEQTVKFYNASTEVETLRITSDGNVGIGTIDPTVAVGSANTAVLASGIVTAYKFYGDGSALTGVSGGSGISTDAQGNTYAGDYAGGSFSGTSAQYNTLYGYDAGGDITTGDYNTCIGWTAGDRITTGSKNVAVGAEALDNLTTGSQNVGVGWEAGRSLSSGNRNTCIGDMAGRSFGSNNDCIAIGYHAASNFGGNNHVIAIGSNSAFLGGTAKIAIGEQSFQKRTDYCIGIGQYSGRYSEGDYNLFLGYTAGQGGYYNGARGIGSNNIAIGHQVLRGYFGAYDNTIIGTRAGYAMTESHSTVAIGVSALKSATTAANNVAIGALSGDSITTGSNNIFIGRRAGYNVDGNNNTIIGSMEYAASTTMNGQVTIGAGTTELVRINDTGVGIGTDNPETNFQVRKAVQSEIRATENVSGHHVSIYQQAIHSYIIAGRSSGTPTQDLLFYTGGTEKLRITSDGEVKMPSQPMMQVWAVTTGSKSVSGNSATTLIPLNAGNTYDPLSDLNSSTGVYTAPVTGRYLTYYGTEGKTTNNASAGSIYYNINNGGISGQCLYYGDQYSGNSKQVILSLAAGDTVKWQIYGNNNQSYSINAAVYGIHLLG